MLETIISKPIYRVLTDLTQQPRVEVSLPIAIKELVTLKLVEANERCHAFEQRYGMKFEAFRNAWDEDRIPDRYGYEVEQDYWDWEAAVADRQKLAEMMDSMTKAEYETDLPPLSGMTESELQVLADAVVSPERQDRVKTLLASQRKRVLSAGEQSDLDHLLDEIDQVALLKARALYTLQAAAIFSPRLVHPQQAMDFRKEVIEETSLG